METSVERRFRMQLISSLALIQSGSRYPSNVRGRSDPTIPQTFEALRSPPPSSGMVKLAILDPVLPHQISERATDLDGIDVVWKGTALEGLLRAVRTHHPKVVVVDLDTLGPDPAARVREVEAASSQVELVITLYRFARRSTVEELTGEGRKTVRAPVTLAGLRSQMLAVVVRSIFATPSGDASSRSHRQRERSRPLSSGASWRSNLRCSASAPITCRSCFCRSRASKTTPRRARTRTTPTRPCIVRSTSPRRRRGARKKRRRWCAASRSPPR